MNTAKIIPFQFKTTEVRTLEINDLIWFVASDVAKALEYPQAKDLARMLDEDERGRQIVPTPSGEQEMVIINESGLYHAILKSRKPEAQPFRKWVTSEVLPAIRKTGRYEAPPKSARKAKALPGGLAVDQQEVIKEMVKARIEAVPQEQRAKAAITCWSALKSKFGKTYKAIPPEQFSDAVSLVARLDLEGKLIPANTKTIDDEYSVEAWLKYNPWIKPYIEQTTDGKKRICMTAFMVYSMDTRSATQMLINELTEKGHNVEACRIELNALKMFISNIRYHLQDIANISQRSLDHTVMVKYSPA